MLLSDYLHALIILAGVSTSLTKHAELHGQIVDQKPPCNHDEVRIAMQTQLLIDVNIFLVFNMYLVIINIAIASYYFTDS